MSIICGKDNIGWIIDHEEFIKKLYTSVLVKNDESEPNLRKRFTFKRNFFEILTPFLCSQEANHNSIEKNKRKRKHDHLLPSQSNFKEVSLVKLALEELRNIQEGHTFFLYSPTSEDFQINNSTARKCASSYYSETIEEKISCFSGGNNSFEPIVVKIKDNCLLIPQNSMFFCLDISELINKLPANNKFDFILMDPPWWNKYVRRRKKNQISAGYKMMYNEEVCALPVSQWLAPGALVGVWCTNCDRHIQDVRTRWFPKWGIHHVATWYWLKVTLSGEPVCQFSPPPGKQPYERILFGCAEHRTTRQPPDNHCIISVPSSIHSHKPPLVEVMKPFLPEQPKCLELFARYLLPNWTSAGDQVLALQNVKLYTELVCNSS